MILLLFILTARYPSHHAISGLVVFHHFHNEEKRSERHDGSEFHSADASQFRPRIVEDGKITGFLRMKMTMMIRRNLDFFWI